MPAVAAKAEAKESPQVAHLEQIKKNLKEKIEKRLPAYQGRDEHRDEAMDRAKAQLEEVEAQLKALKKEEKS